MRVSDVNRPQDGNGGGRYPFPTRSQINELGTLYSMPKLTDRQSDAVKAAWLYLEDRSEDR